MLLAIFGKAIKMQAAIISFMKNICPIHHFREELVDDYTVNLTCEKCGIIRVVAYEQ